MRERTKNATYLVAAMAMAVALFAAPALATTEAERVRPDVGDIEVVVGSVSYPEAEANGGARSGGGHTICTLAVWDLDIFLTTQIESDADQTCTSTVTQRFSKHNFQRQRWYGWQTIEWNEPATSWVITSSLNNTEDDVCWSGTWTYRGIAQGQFKEGGHTHTSPYIVSDQVTMSC